VAVRAARKLVRTHFSRLARGPWDALRYVRRQDLLVVTGYARRYANLFPKGWAAQNLDDYATTVCRMIRLRYFAVAERFIERMVEQKNGNEGILRLAQGRCLVAQERWIAARAALSRALALGQGEAGVALADAALDQGDLDGAERELAVLPKGSIGGLITESRLWRLRERPIRALRAAQAAVAKRSDARSLQALGHAWILSGGLAAARKAFGEAAKKDTVAGREARLDLGRMELLDNKPQAAFDAVWPLTRAPERRLRAASHAVISQAAAAQTMDGLAKLQLERAMYHARADPAALAESRVYALYAYVYGQLRQVERALQSISTALTIRPDYPPYRAIERGLTRLQGQASAGPASKPTPRPKPKPKPKPKP